MALGWAELLFQRFKALSQGANFSVLGCQLCLEALVVAPGGKRLEPIQVGTRFHRVSN